MARFRVRTPEKRNTSWCAALVGIMVPYKIQPREYSTGSGLRWRNGWRGARSVSVGNVNRDRRDWNANVNSLDNGNVWNVDNRLLVRNSFYFLPPSAGVFFSRYMRHFTSILLASTKSSVMRRCWAFVMALHSHPTSRKNFAASHFAIAISSTSIFRCPERYSARNAYSSVSRSASSIRAPIVCRRALATCGNAACHARYASFSFNTTDTSFSCKSVGGGG